MEEFSKICNQESEESTIVYRESLDDFLGGIYFEKNTHQLYFVENIIPTRKLKIEGNSLLLISKRKNLNLNLNIVPLKKISQPMTD